MALTGFTIISGGQTGADRAALEWAIAHDLPHGGWCPQGRKAEDGTIDANFLLKETPSGNYGQRTEWNVRDSDGTVIISLSRVLEGGSQRTLELARKYRKPCLLIARAANPSGAGALIHRFVRQHGIKVLNLAGPRASEEPEVGAFVRSVLDDWVAEAERDPLSAAEIATERLVLRPLNLGDAPTVCALAGRREIADTTISVPHPYPVEKAQEWIRRQTMSPGSEEFVFGITLKGTLIGAIGLRDMDYEHNQAEMGFWIGVDWWKHGYATEAARAMVRYGFQTLQLNRIIAHHMARNPASGRVLQKIGLKQEGFLRQDVRKWGVYEDVVLLAILREEWKDL
jgi:RimJ/RimL family protein N-acetyltransferase